MMVTVRKSLIALALVLLPSIAFAASGPLAEGFGRESWLEKVHVVAVVVAVVLLASGVLVFAILSTEDGDGDDEDA